jgi:hypothetical protein
LRKTACRAGCLILPRVEDFDLAQSVQAFLAPDQGTLEVEVHAAPDQQISLTDPDARAMATNGKGTGLVGYNVQVAVDAEHHLIVAHEVTNIGHDRGQLANMAGQAKAAMGAVSLTPTRLH